MIVELLTLGNELLDGRRIDSNTGWMGRYLTAFGLEVRYRQTTQDRKDDIAQAFLLAMQRSDLIISTGGLGPTQDDITFESLAQALDEPLEFHANIFQEIEKKYEKRGLPCPSSNRRQAMLPRSAFPIPAVGTAPGCFVEKNNRMIFCFPGVPMEMKTMFETFFVEKLKATRVIRPIFQLGYTISGIAEALVEEKLLEHQLNQLSSAQVNVAYTASQSEVDVTFSVLPNETSETEKIKSELHEKFLHAFAGNLIKWDDQTIEEHIVQWFITKKWMLSVAESITGGMITSKIVNVAGCSKMLDCGLVTYSYRSKETLLDVQHTTLVKSGAVSAECVAEMVRGLKKNSGANVVVAICGIAGPGGATENKPLGMTYIGWMGPPLNKAFEENYVKCTNLQKKVGPTHPSADMNKNRPKLDEYIFNDDQGFIHVRGFIFSGDRHRNRVMAANQALMGLHEFIKTYT